LPKRITTCTAPAAKSTALHPVVLHLLLTLDPPDLWLGTWNASAAVPPSLAGLVDILPTPISVRSRRATRKQSCLTTCDDQIGWLLTHIKSIVLSQAARLCSCHRCANRLTITSATACFIPATTHPAALEGDASANIRRVMPGLLLLQAPHGQCQSKQATIHRHCR